MIPAEIVGQVWRNVIDGFLERIRKCWISCFTIAQLEGVVFDEVCWRSGQPDLDCGEVVEDCLADVVDTA